MSQLAANNVKVVICAVYRSGSTDVKLFEYVESVMDTVRSEGSRIILAGDFNVHNRQWLNSTRTTVAGEYAEDMCILHGLEQHVTMPTRRNNTLDLIMSDFPLRVTVTTQPPLGASDHVVVIADFPALVPKEPLTHRTVWRYNHADWDRLRHFYKESDWESLITGDPDQSCENVTSLILSGMSKFIPSRALVSRPSDPSWWTLKCSLCTAKQWGMKADDSGTLPLAPAKCPASNPILYCAASACSGNTYHTVKGTTCEGQPHGQAMVVYHQARWRRATELFLP